MTRPDVPVQGRPSRAVALLAGTSLDPGEDAGGEVQPYLVIVERLETPDARERRCHQMRREDFDGDEGNRVTEFCRGRAM
jgi:hypothetical protein